MYTYSMINMCVAVRGKQVLKVERSAAHIRHVHATRCVNNVLSNMCEAKVHYANMQTGSCQYVFTRRHEAVFLFKSCITNFASHGDYVVSPSERMRFNYRLNTERTGQVYGLITDRRWINDSAA